MLGNNGYHSLQQDESDEESNSATGMLQVNGMTCQSCVRSIEDKISDEPGVHKIKVSLAEKNAAIEYDPSVTSLEKLRDAIEDMGFEAILPSSRSGPLDVRIGVVGMTCNSCVKSIEGCLMQTDGVLKAQVSLSEGLAFVQYDPSVTSPETLCTVIEDAGFQASVSLLDKGPVTKSKTTILTKEVRLGLKKTDFISSSIIIEENSFGKDVEMAILSVKGSSEVKLNWDDAGCKEGEAIIKWQADLPVSIEEINSSIKALGYTASLKDTPGTIN
ncbi:hypothetical protein J437_LFUL011922, partial [Ladona fulva]